MNLRFGSWKYILYKSPIFDIKKFYKGLCMFCWLIAKLYMYMRQKINNILKHKKILPLFCGKNKRITLLILPLDR